MWKLSVILNCRADKAIESLSPSKRNWRRLKLYISRIRDAELLAREIVKAEKMGISWSYVSR